MLARVDLNLNRLTDGLRRGLSSFAGLRLGPRRYLDPRLRAPKNLGGQRPISDYFPLGLKVRASISSSTSSSVPAIIVMEMA